MNLSGADSEFESISLRADKCVVHRIIAVQASGLGLDVEFVTMEGKRGYAFSIYEVLPLPVPVDAAMKSDLFAFLEAGVLFVSGFAYGRADHTVIG